jgi:cobalamin biosynthetic protein CobC
MEHGGQLQAATAAFGAPDEGWLDLSTGINPRPYPVPDLPMSVWARLPDSDLYKTGRDAALTYWGAPASAGIVEAPGSQALIQALPRLRPPGRAAVVGFTYAEHAHCWRASGHEIVAIEDIADIPLADVRIADTVILANPNNPDGRLVEPGRLGALAMALAAVGGLLVVDEAFADVATDVSLAPIAGRPGLCILRSFGKFFGLAGIRLGHALAEPSLAARLEAELGPWRVSGPALEIGRRAMSDAAWIAATRRELAEAAARLDDLLDSNGLKIVGGTDLFRLAELDTAPALHQALGRHGILTRRFADRPRWLRFGLPPDEAAWQRLARALQAAA